MAWGDHPKYPSLGVYLQVLMWKIHHRPRYHAGQKVRNRYDNEASRPKTLLTYKGPYIGWQAGKWGVTETWKTVDDFEVAVGYFWLPI